MLTSHHWSIILFTTLYLVLGGIYFLQDLNHEFIIYVVVMAGILGGVFATLKHTTFPLWMLWLLSLWGLLHVLGGAVETGDGVLSTHLVYPLLGLGSELYILTYDQVVHAYFYGLVALLSLHVLRMSFGVVGNTAGVALAAILISIGISGLSDVMEFLIAVSLEGGGGRHENAMLDLLFNLGGAVLAVGMYVMVKGRV